MATPSVDLIARLRRLTNEPTVSPYSDELLSSMLAAYPLMDSAGAEPTDDAWLGAWDINRAAADVWEEKAAALAGAIDFAADGASFSRSQAHQHALALVKQFRGRRRVTSVTVPVYPAPAETDAFDYTIVVEG